MTRQFDVLVIPAAREEMFAKAGIATLHGRARFADVKDILYAYPTRGSNREHML